MARLRNLSGVKSWLYSERFRELVQKQSAGNGIAVQIADVNALVDEAYEKAGHYLADVDRGAVEVWAYAHMRRVLGQAVLQVLGSFKRDGDDDLIVRRLDADNRAWASAELDAARQLGFTPAARAALGLDVARGRVLDLASEIAQAKAKQVNGR